MVMFSGIYLTYKFYTDKSYFELKDITNNELNLTTNPFTNAILPPILIISLLSQLRFTSLYLGHKMLPVSISLPLTAMSLFAVIGFAHYLRGEKITHYQIIASIMVFIGVIVINLNKILGNTKEAHSIKNTHYVIGILAILTSTILTGYLLTKFKTMSENVTPIQVMFNESVGAFFAMTIAMMIYVSISSTTFSKIFGFDKKIPSFKNAILFFLVFFFVFNFSTVTRFIGLNNLDEITMSVITKTKVIIALLIGFYFFNEHITMEKNNRRHHNIFRCYHSCSLFS